MNGLARFLSTAMVWVMCGGISIVSIADGPMSSGKVVVVIVALGIAFVTTATIWETEEQKNQDSSKEKRKRGSGSELDLLMSMMDADEQEAFKERLQQRILNSTSRLTDDDGDIAVSLEELMARQHEEKELRR